MINEPSSVPLVQLSAQITDTRFTVKKKPWLGSNTKTNLTPLLECRQKITYSQ